MKAKYFIMATLTSLLMTIAIFILHTNHNLRSMINLEVDTNHVISDSYLTTVVEYHKELFDFAKRPLTTFLVEKTSSIVRIGIGESFVLVNFLFLFLNGMLLYLLSARHFCNSRQGVINVLMYYLSFSVLFTFFIPVYSYDEPIQYFFIFGTLVCFFEKWWLAFIVCAFLALVARETSILILAGLFILSVKRHDAKIKMFVCFAAPMILYGFFIYYFIESKHLWTTLKADTTARQMAFFNNFADAQYALETIFAVINSSLVPVYFICMVKRQLKDVALKTVLNIILMIFLLNTIITIMLTSARETRLFNLPFVMFYPVSYLVVFELKRVFTRANIYNKFSRLPTWMIFVGGTVLIYIFSVKIFKTTIGIGSDDLFNEYSFFIMMFVFLHNLLQKERKLAQPNQVPE